jgi:hypothetical protein
MGRVTALPERAVPGGNFFHAFQTHFSQDFQMPLGYAAFRRLSAQTDGCR